MLHVINDLSHRREAFAPQEPPRVTMYVCGPTVYDYAHLGHAKSYVAWDIVHRYLEWRGYEVTLAQNFTDIDDKIIRRATENGEDWKALTERFIEAYLQDMDRMNVLRADVYPRATEHIPEMIRHIEGLIAKGIAYAVEGDVYYAVEKFPSYGELSGRDFEQMQAGARVEVEEKKHNPLDFALWKASKPGEPSWESPWGPGRPGWHIECSAMAHKHLGETLDIHTGGLDLLFPHHENEIAQSEALTGHIFARYWLHNGFVTVDAEKMGKSLGNFFTLRELLKEHDPQEIRFFLLSMHYRQETDFSEAGIRSAGTGLMRLRRSLARWADKRGEAHPEIQRFASELRERFAEAMDDDFNTPKAIAVLFDASKELGALVERVPEAEASAGHGAKAVLDLGDVLGIDLQYGETHDLSGLDEPLLGIAEEILGARPVTVDEALDALIERRTRAKQEKDWALADRIRNQLRDLGVSLMDKPGGQTTWERLEGVGHPSR